MAEPTVEVPLRIVMQSPPKGVAIALQRGATAKGDHVPPSNPAADDLVFEFSVRADLSQPGRRPRLLGPFVQGPPDGRFVYIGAGACAGRPHPVWSRRAKVPLTAITREMIEGLAPGARLEARFPGTGRDGGPTCASVKLPPPGWTVVDG